MDKRIALKDNTKLVFCTNTNGIVVYIVRREIARGGSCIVYDAFYTNNSGNQRLVRIKECYPFQLNITREKDDSLVPTKDESDAFLAAKKQMRKAFDIGNELFTQNGITNSTSNTLDIYEKNNSIYIITTYLEGETFSQHSFSSLKDCISAVESTAVVIHKIHEKGYLYLDLKPDNIFVIKGTTELVQLFDFDSLIPIESIESQNEGTNLDIPFTNGFAAPEQQNQQYRKIGKHSDVYGIGALLFFLVFGHTPTVLDCCDKDAVYDYAVSKFAPNLYQDRLFFELTIFFHNSLANHYRARYQNLQPVIQKLDDLIKLADLTSPYIFSTRIHKPGLFLGRDAELNALNLWINQDNNNCLFITGMGGIGKSTLVREFIASANGSFDSILYLNYAGSIAEMISDDNHVQINTVKKTDEESLSDYFNRKLRCIRNIVKDTRSLLIIDNFFGEIDQDLILVMNVDWKIVIVSRFNPPSENYDWLPIQVITNREILYEIFASNSKKAIQKQDRNNLDHIIDLVAGHTLVLELIAKQIAKSHLSIAEARKLVDKRGFSRIAPEKVGYEKDTLSYHDTIQNIIEGIFSAENLSTEKRRILKVLSLFDISGININHFAEMIRLNILIDINDLIEEGWLYHKNEILSLHPVIRETISLWKWTENYQSTAKDIMRYLFNQLMIYENNDDYPKRYLIADREIGEASTNYPAFDKTAKYFSSLWGDKFIFMQLSKSVLACVKDNDSLRSEGIYKDLRYSTIINSPRDEEDYILEGAKELLADTSASNGCAVMSLYDLIVFLYAERNEFEKAQENLLLAEDYSHEQESFVKARYHSLAAGFYDSRLGGSYDHDNKFKDRKNFLWNMNRAIRFISMTHDINSKLLLAKFKLFKTNSLIRSFPGKKREIDNLLNNSMRICEEQKAEQSNLGVSYFLTRALYYSIIVPDKKTAISFLDKASEIGKIIYSNELDFIDTITIPYANRLFELEDFKGAEEKILEGIGICKNKERIVPYLRKKIELYHCLLDIYSFSECDEKFEEIEEIINKELDLYADLII